MGMSPRTGIFFMFSTSSLVVKPPMATVLPLSTLNSVSIFRDWVTEQVYNTAREVGVEIQWVERVVNNEAAQLSNAGAADVVTPYKVRVLSVCSYSKCIQFIELLEQGNPYLCISEITISGQSDNVEKHRVNFVAEWPSWSDPEAIQALSMNE